MKKYLILKLVFIFLSLNIFAQQTSPDSLSAHLKNCLNVPAEGLIQAVNTPFIEGFILVDPVTDKDLRPLKSKDTIYTNIPYNIRVDAVNAQSVRIRYGPNFNRVENQAPFSLKGDDNGDYDPWFPTPGVYTLTATPYSEKFGQGTVGTSVSIQLVVLVSPTVRFVLINSDTDTEIMEVKEGTIIDLGQLPTTNLNIRADINWRFTQSVKFGLNAKSTFRVENEAPYALFGDIRGDYNAWNPLTGSYTLTATAFSGNKATGAKGPSATIHFSVVETQVSTTSYIEFNNLVVIYRNTDGGTLGPDTKARVEGTLARTTLFYWRHTYMKLKINWTIIEIEEFRDVIEGNGFIPPHIVNAELLSLGYMPSFTPGTGYDVVHVVASGSGNYAYTPNVILGRAGYFQTGFFGDQDNFGIAVHEFHHVIDNMFNSSGFPLYPHNHPGAARVLGEFVPHSGPSWDLNKEILHFWDKERWQALRLGVFGWGIIKTAVDLDGDGIPDNDPSVPLDEARLGSSTKEVDSDSDGLTDLQEVMAGIFEGTDPLDADTDEDGINDGADSEPIYPFNTSVLAVSSLNILHNIITWPQAGSYYFDHPNDHMNSLHLANSSDNLYIGLKVETDLFAPIHVFIDADNDGIFYGKDNLEIILSGSTIQSVRLYDAASVPSGSIDDFIISQIPTTGFSGISKLITGGVTYQLAIPRLSQYGLNLTSGEQIGVFVTIDNYGSMLEYDDFITLTLGQTPIASKQASASPQEALGISLFPNPAENQLTVSWNSSIMPQAIRILNVNGNEVYSRNVNSPDAETLSVESLSSGIYSIQLVSEGEVRTVRFVKK